MIASIGEILFDVFPESSVLGGAPFNFIFHIIKLLNRGMFISGIGEDPTGEQILSFLEKENISPDFIQKNKKYPTGAAFVKVNPDGTPEFVIKENCAYDYINQSPALNDYLRKNIQMLYYGTLAQRNSVSQDTIKSLWNLNLKYFYDANIRQNYFTREIIESSLMRADVVKMNLQEFSFVNQLLFNQPDSNSDIKENAIGLMSEFDIDLLCVTQGADGAWLFKGEQANHFKVKAENIKDTVGAGDAYSAILAIGYLSDWEIEKINYIASDFAAGICGVKGAIPDNSFYEKYRVMLDKI